MSAYQKRYLMIGLAFVVLMIAVGGYLIYQHERPVPITKPEVRVFDPASLPEPPDPSIPKERTITFAEKTYTVYWSGFCDEDAQTYITYENGINTFTINRETDQVIAVEGFINQLGSEEQTLRRNEVRALLPDVAGKITDLDLSHFTVTEQFFARGSCVHNAEGKYVGERIDIEYTYRWIYGSEDPAEVLANSFAFTIHDHGDVSSFERPEAVAVIDSVFAYRNPEDEVYVQLSTTVPFPPFVDKSIPSSRRTLSVEKLDEVVSGFVMATAHQPSRQYRFERSEKYFLTENWEKYATTGPFYDYKFYYLGEVTQASQRLEYSYFIRVCEDGTIVESRKLAAEEWKNWQ